MGPLAAAHVGYINTQALDALLASLLPEGDDLRWGHDHGSIFVHKLAAQPVHVGLLGFLLRLWPSEFD